MARRKMKSFQNPEKNEKKLERKSGSSRNKISEDDNQTGAEFLSCENKPELYLQLQQTCGNRYTREIAGSSSTKPAAGGLIRGNIQDEEICLGGEGDDNSYVEDDNPYLDEENSDETGTSVSISSNTGFGPLWEDNGRFDWAITFNTTGRDGWIVQEINNTYSAHDIDNKDYGWADVDPHYWEAWYVDESGTISPEEQSFNDYWVRTTRDDGSSGMWTVDANLFFVKKFDPALIDFLPSGVENAGELLSTTREPQGLGPVLMRRSASGIWDVSGEHAGDAS